MQRGGRIAAAWVARRRRVRVAWVSHWRRMSVASVTRGGCVAGASMARGAGVQEGGACQRRAKTRFRVKRVKLAVEPDPVGGLPRCPLAPREPSADVGRLGNHPRENPACIRFPVR